MIMRRIPVAPTPTVVDLAEQSERAIALLVSRKESLPYRPSTGLETAAEVCFSDFLNHVQAVLEFAKSDLSFLASACTLTRRAFELLIEGVWLLQSNLCGGKDCAPSSEAASPPLGFRDALCAKHYRHEESTLSRSTIPTCSWERDADPPTHIEFAVPLVYSNAGFATLQSRELQAIHARITAQRRTIPDGDSSERKGGHPALGEWYEVLAINWEQVRTIGTLFLSYQGADKKSWITTADQIRFSRLLSRASRSPKRRSRSDNRDEKWSI